MKKWIAFLLTAVLCVALVACGGPDKQPAIDAHNKAGEAVNALADIINADPETYADWIPEMNELVEQLNQCGEYLSKTENAEQDALDEWVGICKDIEQWAIDAKAELEG